MGEDRHGPAKAGRLVRRNNNSADRIAAVVHVISSHVPAITVVLPRPKGNKNMRYVTAITQNKGKHKNY